MFSIPWYIFLLQFVAGLFLANGVPHFVQGISGAWFQTPFASPPGVGESSPVVNVLWGFLNLVIGFALLFEFAPKGADVVLEWVFVGLGALLIALFCAWHFGRVRAGGGKGSGISGVMPAKAGILYLRSDSVRIGSSHPAIVGIPVASLL